VLFVWDGVVVVLRWRSRMGVALLQLRLLDRAHVWRDPDRGPLSVLEACTDVGVLGIGEEY
jgi:hypothetical protein